MHSAPVRGRWRWRKLYQIIWRKCTRRATDSDASQLYLYCFSNYSPTARNLFAENKPQQVEWKQIQIIFTFISPSRKRRAVQIDGTTFRTRTRTRTRSIIQGRYSDFITEAKSVAYVFRSGCFLIFVFSQILCHQPLHYRSYSTERWGLTGQP